MVPTSDFNNASSNPISSSSRPDNNRKRKSRKGHDDPNSVAKILAKWKEINSKPDNGVRKAPAKGSKKGCVKGKGGPENGGAITGELGRGLGVNGLLKSESLIEEKGCGLVLFLLPLKLHWPMTKLLE